MFFNFLPNMKNVPDPPEGFSITEYQIVGFRFSTFEEKELGKCLNKFEDILESDLELCCFAEKIYPVEEMKDGTFTQAAETKISKWDNNKHVWGNWKNN